MRERGHDRGIGEAEGSGAMGTANWAAQVVATRVSLDQLATKYPQQQFKVGRCGLAACDGEWDGEDYRSAERFVRIWRGSAAEAARLEADLVRHARKKHAARCRNAQASGSPSDQDEPQVIYLAIWPKTG
jgi:hypothetical protein